MKILESNVKVRGGIGKNVPSIFVPGLLSKLGLYNFGDGGLFWWKCFEACFSLATKDKGFLD